MSSSSTDVLVVGAGPTGLTLAADLLRRGLRVRLVDRAGAPAPTSRATSVTPRTLEVLDDLGIAQRLVDAGVPLTVTEAFADGRRAFRLAFPESDATRFPYLLNISQRRTEEELTSLVARLGGRVERGCALAGFRQERDAVVARLDGPDGPEEVRAAWLVGADGGRSTVRRTLGVPFRGRGGQEETIVLADVLVDRDLPADRIYSWFNEDGALLAFPFPEPGRWRITAALSPAEEADGTYVEESLDRFTALYRRRTGDTRTTLSDMVGFSVYRVNQRVVDHYRRGRVLLAGDAAHVHTPAGGLGMNTGVQDAYALGWRLAAAVRDGDDDAVDGYERERRPVAEALLTSTGGLQRLWSIRDPLLQRTRDTALRLLLGLGPLQRAFFLRAGQLDIGYAPRRLRSRGLQVGDRAPDGPARSWPDRAPARLHDVLRGTAPVLLLFGDGPVEHRPGVRTVVVARTPAAAAASGATALLDEDGLLHRRYGAVSGRAVLVRPDGHVDRITAGTVPAAA
jgi:2-polyprenyl-6-methoxyphenol hydroxylase-like FAD-dependent oxidoreductase